MARPHSEEPPTFYFNVPAYCDSLTVFNLIAEPPTFYFKVPAYQVVIVYLPFTLGMFIAQVLVWLSI